jgi:hypothetical protein
MAMLSPLLRNLLLAGSATCVELSQSVLLPRQASLLYARDSQSILVPENPSSKGHHRPVIHSWRGLVVMRRLGI